MFFFFFNDTATTEIYTLSLHDALPISPAAADVLQPHRRLAFGHSVALRSRRRSGSQGEGEIAIDGAERGA